MPPRALERKADLVSVRIFSDDMEYLKLTYTAGYNVVFRALVSRHVRKLRERTKENLDTETLTKEELASV
jgi:hypothetical protein